MSQMTTGAGKRAKRVIRLHKLPAFLGIERSQIQKLIELGILHPFSLGPGGRSQVVEEDEVAAYQAEAKAKARRKREDEE